MSLTAYYEAVEKLRVSDDEAVVVVVAALDRLDSLLRHLERAGWVGIEQVRQTLAGSP